MVLTRVMMLMSGFGMVDIIGIRRSQKSSFRHWREVGTKCVLLKCFTNAIHYHFCEIVFFRNMVRAMVFVFVNVGIEVVVLFESTQFFFSLSRVVLQNWRLVLHIKRLGLGSWHFSSLYQET